MLDFSGEEDNSFATGRRGCCYEEKVNWGSYKRGKMERGGLGHFFCNYFGEESYSLNSLESSCLFLSIFSMTIIEISLKNRNH